MNNSPNQKETKSEESAEPDFHGAALIDKSGKEIPITEKMVQKACTELDSTRAKASQESED